jgi:hypothetical protein
MTLSSAWRLVASGGLVLGASATLLAAVLFSRQSQNTAAIQQQRVDAIRSSCQETNARHDQTIKTLKGLVARIDDPAQRARAHRNLAGTLALIDALVPKQNCAARVRRVASPVQ